MELKFEARQLAWQRNSVLDFESAGLGQKLDCKGMVDGFGAPCQGRGCHCQQQQYKDESFLHVD